MGTGCDAARKRSITMPALMPALAAGESGWM